MVGPVFVFGPGFRLGPVLKPGPVLKLSNPVRSSRCRCPPRLLPAPRPGNG